MTTSAVRPRLLVLNEYYWPGLEATARLLAELCEALAEEVDVTVLTGALRGRPELPGKERRRGVEIVRVRSTTFDRAQLPARAANYVSYLGLAMQAGLSAPRPDAVLCMTDPPIVGNVALVVARRFRSPLVVISQDVFPEIAVELGRLDSRPLASLLRVLVRFYLERADRVVAIGETMRQRLEDKGADRSRLRVIPNWVDTVELTPQPRDNPWARRHKLHDRFVVMHSGNVGHAQNLDALVRAGTFLRDLRRLRILIVGTGARHHALVALARRLEADRVSFMSYQPRELLSQSLSAADVHVIGLAPGLAGYVVPSRILGVLAVGRPVIVAADDRSEVARIVREAECGFVVPPARPELLAGAIRDAYAGRDELAEMGRRGREWVERQAGREIAIERYRRLLEEVREERLAGVGATSMER